MTAHAQQHQHNEHLSTMLEHYLEAKDALTEDDAESAHKHISSLAEEARQNEEMNNHEEHAEMHAEHHGAMIEALEKAEQAEDIDELRLAFKSITEQLVKAVENQDFEGEEELYLQYCPMADNNEGAYWLSEEETIVNPYMGHKMPECGSTEKVIEMD
ncbi:MAG: DUF3347 domain-containing protein [Balneolaceae bacterium]